MGLILAPAGAQASGPPQVTAAWSSEVVATSARLRAEINPEGAKTTYHFNYLTQAAYEANLAGGREGFYGALKAPAGTDPSIGEGSGAVAVAQSISSLSPETAYRYRVVATNSQGVTTAEANGAGAPLLLRTQGLGGGTLLADGRGWEMVSPIDKNGGGVQGPGQIYGGGVFAAASGGGAVTYSSTASFGQGAQGAPYASQYISRRTESGWNTQNITTPIESGSYGEHPDGVPYQLFSQDLSYGLVLNGEHCRSEATTGCPVANPPLPGSGAPEGFQDYYLRDDETGSYTALMTQANSPALSQGAEAFSLALAGASPDLAHVVLSTCAKLTADATEQPVCESGGPNLYEWSGGQLRLVNKLGSDSTGTSDAHLAAQSGAISADGSRVYFSVGEGAALYLREGEAGAKLLAEGASFQTAAADGSIAFYTKEEGTSGKHLYRYEAIGEQASDLTPAGEVKGVLGASEDGQTVYYQDASGLERRHAGTTTQIASGAQAASEGDWPPATGTARVSTDGEALIFLSKGSEALTGYDNTDQATGKPDSELFLWSTASGLLCLSCNPTNERPLGPSLIPGAYANGTQGALKPGQILTDSYKPRALSANGRRVFFTSQDALVLSDTDNAPDAYEWEAQGEGSCTKAGGCLALVSSGRSAGGASFIDASADGSDAFFLTAGSLVPSDPGSADIYDARVGGGFPEAPNQIPCNGDACQVLPPEPEDPEPGSLREGPGNPPLTLPAARKCRKGYARKHGHCVRLHKKRHHRRRHR